MTSFDPGAHPQPIDIANMYRLALGRDPEADGVIKERLDQPNKEWMPGFFVSSEFAEKVYDKVLAGAEIGGGLFDRPPSPELRSWAANFFPLTEESGERVAIARSWYEIFYHLFSDPAFIEHALRGEERPTHAAFIDRMQEQCARALQLSIDGALESIVPGEITGWALDRQDMDRRLLVELYVNDIFVLAAPTAEYREDLRNRFGGKGWYGFRLRYDVAPSPGQALRAVVREAGSQAVLAAFDLPPVQAFIDEVTTIRDAITQVQDLLKRVEARLPALNYGLTMPLAAYDDYFARYYDLNAPPHLQARESVACAVIIDATSHPAGMLERLLHSLDAQSKSPSEIVVLHASGEAGLEVSCCLRSWQPAANDVRLTSIEVANDVAGSLPSTARMIQASWIIWCPAHHWLRPDAVDLLDRAMGDSAALVYGDSDVVRRDASGREMHIAPKLHTSFDYDFLLQQNYLDAPIACRRDLLLTSKLERGDVAHLQLALALQLSELKQDRTIRHIPRILSHAEESYRPAEQALEDRRRTVERHFARSGIAAKVEDRFDVLGTSVPGSLRVRRTPDKATRVAVIVPTRDRRDLLEPCLTSIFRSQAHNVVSVEIIVIDNGSSDAATLQYLEQIAMLGQARVLMHDGPFNWALMNNRAAAETNADVLVFLNNDTAVLSNDCWDEISSNVLRPMVGALGARLLYEDGSIQHAGAVLDGWTSFSRHEGMGRPARDAGYLGRNALLRRVSTVTGACLATKATLFRELRGFDSANLPVEGNDTDYCLKLADRGYAILYDPYVTFYHFESKSRGYNVDDRSRLLADEASRLLRARWQGRVGVDPFYNSHFDPLSPPCARLRPPPVTDGIIPL